MEKKNLIIFDDGLREAHENPFNISQKIKEEFVDEIGADFLLKVFLPIISVTWHICTHNQIVFRYILEDIDGRELFRKSPRLKPSEIYNILVGLSKQNSDIILNRLDCNDGVLEDLMGSISQKNRDKFIEIIRNSNSQNITPYLIPFSIPDAIRTWIVENLSEESVEKIRKKYGDNDDVIIDFLIHGLQKYGEKYFDEFPEIISSSNIGCRKGFQLSKESDGINFITEISQSFYKIVFYLYYSCKEELLLKDEEIKVIEEILNQPEYKEWYNNLYKEYTNGTLTENAIKNDCLKIFPELAPGFSDVQTEDIADAVIVEEGTDEGPGSKDSDYQEETKPLIQGNQVPILEKRADSWPLPTDFFEPDFIDFSCPIEEYFPNFLKNIGTIDFSNEESVEKCAYLSKGFSDFINDIAGLNYIKNNDETKLAFAHALTGRKVKTSVSKVEWKRPNPLSGKKCDWLNDLCYMVRELYPQTISGIKKYEHLKTVFAGVEKNLQSSYADNARGRIKGCVDKFLNCARKNLSK